MSLRLPASAALAGLLAAACDPAVDPPPDGGGAPLVADAPDFAGRSQARLDVEIAAPVPGDAAAAKARADQARAEVALGRQDAALKLLEEAVRLDPANVDALLFTGTLLLAKGLVFDPSRALIAFRTARVVAPGNVAARVGEAVARVELEDDERGFELARALLEDEAAGRVRLADDQRGALRRSCARVGLRARRYDEALRDVDAAIALREGDRASVLLRAELFERTDRAADALAELERAIRMRPEDSTAHFARARVLRRMGRAADAEQEMRIYRALLPFEEEATKSFATEWPRRIQLRRDLIAAWPEMRRAHHLLVRELIGGRLLDEARGELDRLLADQPGDAEALFLLAKLHAAQGDKPAARAAAERMLATGKASRATYDDLLREIEGSDGAAK